MKADLNVCSALARLAHLVSLSYCSSVLLFMPVLASNFVILAHGRQTSINCFKWIRIYPGAALPRYPSGGGLYEVFVAKGYEHIWASSGHHLKWAFCGCLNDLEAHAYVRTCLQLAMPLVIFDITELRLVSNYFKKI